MNEALVKALAAIVVDCGRAEAYDAREILGIEEVTMHGTSEDYRKAESALRRELSK